MWRIPLILLCQFCVAYAAPAAEKFSFGRLGDAAVFLPARVRHVALVFSGDEGWSARDSAIAKSLVERGVLVAGIDLRHYAAELAKPRDTCSYLAGEFEDFSHEFQKHFSPVRYHQPVLIGSGRAAGLIYGVATQGSSGTFVGTVTIGFQPTWQPLIRLCQSYGLRYDTDKSGIVTFKPTEELATPWIALRSSGSRAWSGAAENEFMRITATSKSRFVADDSQLPASVAAAVDEVAQSDQDPVVLSDELKDLSLTEVRASGATKDVFVIFLTGDGGWAEIDKGVSAELAKHGIDVVALSSLQYFWKPRSPDETAKDVARIMSHYLAAWQKREAIVIGYSFGADVAAFVVNRLPQALRDRVASVNLMGPAETADFEVHVTTWLGVDHHGLQTKPEVDRLSMRVLCVIGEGEKDSLCPKLQGANVERVQIGSGHHFGNRYKEIAEAVVNRAQAR